MNDFPALIVRFSEPTEYDQAPFCNICEVKNEYYVQISEDENRPIWQKHAGDLESAKIYVQQLKK